MFYLDDGTVGGIVNDVLHDLELVEEEACRLGLHLNHEKSELICDDPNAGNLNLSVSSDLSVVSRNQATLLSTPLCCTDSIDAVISLKVENLKLMGGTVVSSFQTIFPVAASALPRYSQIALSASNCSLLPITTIGCFDEVLRGI